MWVLPPPALHARRYVHTLPEGPLQSKGAMTLIPVLLTAGETLAVQLSAGFAKQTTMFAGVLPGAVAGRGVSNVLAVAAVACGYGFGMMLASVGGGPASVDAKAQY